MTAATDYFLKVGQPGTATTLSAPGYNKDFSTTINVGSTANFPNDDYFIFAIDNATVQNGVQVRTTASYCVFVGTVASATSISGVALLYGTPQNYTASATTRVYVPISSLHTNRTIDGIRLFANQDGSLKAGAVKTALGVTSNTGGGWDILNAGTAPTVSSGYNHGNKEFALTFAGVDLTSTLSNGMRLKFDRGTTAPTQSMSFTAASSQYASKASPTGITFTSAFTIEAWVYLNSYTSGSMVMSKLDTSAQNGWYMQISSMGQIEVSYRIAGSATTWLSYQSLPLKRWVHVAAVVSSVSGKTLQGVYLNGTAVPANITASAQTTLTQGTGPLEIGGYNGANNPFDGYISEARLWAAAQTATQVTDNMAISLTGTETNLVGLWQGNGNFNDKTANANNLTAAGGAVSTQAANPYNTTEFGIVTKSAYAGGNTVATVFTGTDYNIPLMTLQNPYSSYQKTPFGFPADKGKWTVSAIYKTDKQVALPGTNQWTSSGIGISSIPIGGWRLDFSGTFRQDSTTSSTRSLFVTLSDIVPTNGTNNQEMTGRLITPGSTFAIGQIGRSSDFLLNTQTTYLLFGEIDNSSGTETFSIAGSQGAVVVRAECAYI